MNISSLQCSKESILSSIKDENYRIEYQKEKIAQLNANLRKNGYLWLAGENELSSMPYSKKVGIFGTNNNTYGVEYYIAGIFSAKSNYHIDESIELHTIKQTNESYTKENSAINVYDTLEGFYIPEWDWRNRHGATDPNSPYFDNDPDFSITGETSNGWMTAIKNQLEGYRYTNGCYIFAPLAAIEAHINLYYNHHFDENLSEQHVLSCDGYPAAPNKGGYVSNTLSFIKNSGAIFENCFPWEAYECPCDTAAKCLSPTNKTKNTNFYSHYVRNYSNDQIKELILENGPSVGNVFYQKSPSLFSGHSMCLVGFGVVEEGDLLWQKGILGQDENCYVPESSELIGLTYWIFKNSTTISAGVNGYRYYIIDGAYNYLSSIYTVSEPKEVITSNYDVSCYDHDGDGFYNWGIGPKPLNCPPCPNLPEGDDNNPNIGPLNEYGYSSYLFPFSESFEVDVNTWFQSSTDDFNWTRQSGSTPSYDTGPSSAVDGDFYFYVSNNSKKTPCNDESKNL